MKGKKLIKYVPCFIAGAAWIFNPMTCRPGYDFAVKNLRNFYLHNIKGYSEEVIEVIPLTEEAKKIKIEIKVKNLEEKFKK